jgi:DNA modification methylase
MSGEYRGLLLTGDCIAGLSILPDALFQTCITSPPYWGLRDYSLPNQIGLERDVSEYVARVTDAMDAVWRILRPDGTLWLNVGDSYTSGNRTWRAPDRKNPARQMRKRPANPPGLKEKELVGIPWRLAFALQERGWYLRSDIIWHKPNAQPESVKDRPTLSHEYVFLLSKSKAYKFRPERIAEPTADGRSTRNRRTVWSINTVPFKGAHFATFPPDLVRLCLLAGTDPGDLVIDPFFGAGTVGLAAAESGRKFVGIELNPRYVRLARKRVGASGTVPQTLSVVHGMKVREAVDMLVSPRPRSGAKGWSMPAQRVAV